MECTDIHKKYTQNTQQTEHTLGSFRLAMYGNECCQCDNDVDSWVENNTEYRKLFYVKIVHRNKPCKQLCSSK